MPTKGPDPIDSLSEATGARLDRVDRQIEANTRAIAEMGNKIDNLINAISNQNSALERLERAVDKLVTGIDLQRKAIESQSTTMQGFLQLAQQQSRIVEKALDIAHPAAV